MSLVVDAVAKRFDHTAALQDVSLSAPAGAFVALLGPSGSGKTTLLRILGGLEKADNGAVTYDGEDWLNVPARERRAGFVFQQYALFRHMTVNENIAFGLRVRTRGMRPPRREIERRVAELLRLVQLNGVGKRYPNQLSGGQRQRVALARALAIEPKLLLLDEPFGALDAKVRKDLRRWLRELHEALGLTTIFVTHDQEEALDLADVVAVLNEGRIEQMGEPHALYAHPATAFVAEFLGGANRLVGRIEKGQFLIDGAVLPVAATQVIDGPVIAYIRPHELALAKDSEPSIPVNVINVLAAGAMVRLDCRRKNGESVEVALPLDVTLPARGASVRLKLLAPRFYPGPN